MLESSGRKVKVSQKTINQIKNLGMEKALKSAKSMKSNANYVEGLRRMYGSARVNKALGASSAPSASNSAKKGVQNKLKTMNSDAKVAKAMNNNAGVRVKSGGFLSSLGAGVSVPVSMREKSKPKTKPVSKAKPFEGFKGQYPK